MNVRFLLLSVLLVVSGCSTTSKDKDEPIEVSLPYLNAAISSMPDEQLLVLEAVYLGNMHRTPLWSGHSQFSIGALDGQSKFTFAVCETGSTVFDDLFHATPGTRYRFEGMKTKLSDKFYDCVLVTELTPLGTTSVDAGSTYRVSITHADGRQEVLENVAAGQPLRVGTSTLHVEQEK